MFFKLGIVGHMTRAQTIENTLREVYKNIEITFIEASTNTQYDDVIKAIQYHEHYLNGIIFTGVIPYKIVLGMITPRIPWHYLKTDNSQLLSALLRIESKNMGTIENISIDAYSKKDALEIFELIDMNKLPKNVHIAELDIYDEDFLENNYKFHYDSYKNHKGVCITNISDTYDIFKKKGIPTVLLTPSKESIRNEFQELLMEYQLQSKTTSQNVVFQVIVDYYKDPILSTTNYKILSEKARIVDELYTLARRTSGVLTENGRSGYMIFANRDPFDRNVSNQQLLSILYTLSKKVSTSVSVGIGYGQTPHRAQMHSNYALDKAQKNGGNMAYIALDEANIIGPLIPKQMDFSTTTVVDSLISEIVDATSLSSKTVQKLINLKSDSSKEFYSPKELALEFGVTHRTMNRIIEKLELEGYLEMVGKKMLSSSGRPTRIFKLNI